MADPKPNHLWRWMLIVVILGLGGVIASAKLSRWPIQDYDGYLHFAAFATLTLLAVIAGPRAGLGTLLAGLTLLVGITELLQFVPGLNRTPSWSDFSFNICGIAAMLCIITAARALAHR